MLKKLKKLKRLKKQKIKLCANLRISICDPESFRDCEKRKKTQDAGRRAENRKRRKGEWGATAALALVAKGRGEKPCNSLASGLPDRVTPPPVAGQAWLKTNSF